MKPRAKKGATMTPAEIYADVPRSSFFRSICRKPAREHSYCTDHWKTVGLPETISENERLMAEKEKADRVLKPKWHGG